ncbi:hypothetical protein Leryth_013178 [Lithospermum erythrorhizon]|nr:hypothetical protein Leryth_013178 [Lithospermum erythrorhizon]
MASTTSPYSILFLIVFTSVFVEPSNGALVKQKPLLLKYHNGSLLKGTITINLIWYGNFTPSQRSIIVDFLQSLNAQHAVEPSAARWWRTTEKYKGGGTSKVVVGTQLIDESYSIGKYLKNVHIVKLATKGGTLNETINVVLTAKDVYVDGFGSRCGTHGSTRGWTRVAYAWVGNSETQCPGQCAWPFYKPIYGPQGPPLVAPNGDVGVDGMIINLATVLAGTVTNPFNNGTGNGPVGGCSACLGYLAGAYPGYTGQVLLDKVSGASYNAHGINGRKFLLPAMWDPRSSACSTLV